MDRNDPDHPMYRDYATTDDYDKLNDDAPGEEKRQREVDAIDLDALKDVTRADFDLDRLNAAIRKLNELLK